MLSLKHLDHYIEEDRPVDISLQNIWDRGDRRAQAIIGLAPSSEYSEQSEIRQLCVASRSHPEVNECRDR